MKSDIQRLIFELRERPQDFVLGEHTLNHKPSGQRIWIANGRAYYKLYRPYEIKFTYLDRHRFHRVFKWWMRGARMEQRFWLRNWLCEPTTETIKATELAL